MNAQSSFQEPRQCRRQEGERGQSADKSIPDHDGRGGASVETAMPPPSDELPSRHRGENLGASTRSNASLPRSHLVLRARSQTVRPARGRWQPPNRLVRNRPRLLRIRFCGSKYCSILNVEPTELAKERFQIGV